MDSGLSPLFYRETVRDSGIGDEKIIRPIGAGHVYAHIRVIASALGRGKGTIFAWNAGDNIPARFAPAVVQGIQNAINTGILAGLEVTDVHVSIEDGSYHELDSNEAAFREAAEKATAEALRQAHPVILEAFALLTVEVPWELVSTVEKIVSLGSGQMKLSQSESGLQSVIASLPASQVQALMVALLEATSGRVNIISTITGFQPRPDLPDPPETVDRWSAT